MNSGSDLSRCCRRATTGAGGGVTTGRRSSPRRSRRPGGTHRPVDPGLPGRSPGPAHADLERPAVRHAAALGTFLAGLHRRVRSSSTLSSISEPVTAPFWKLAAGPSTDTGARAPARSTPPPPSDPGCATASRARGAKLQPVPSSTGGTDRPWQGHGHVLAVFHNPASRTRAALVMLPGIRCRWVRQLSLLELCPIHLTTSVVGMLAPRAVDAK